MRAPSWASGWQAFSIALGLIIGGTTMMASRWGSPLMAPQWGPSADLLHRLGYVLLLTGLVALLVALVLRRGRNQRRRDALDAVDRLIALGEVVWRISSSREASQDRAREHWRAAVHNRLRRPPFVRRAAHWVLSADDPLGRLRRLQRKVDRWIE